MIKKMSKKNGLFLVLSMILALSIFLTGCGGNSGSDSDANSNKGSDKPKVVTMALSATWDTLMPHNTTSGYSDVIFDLIYDRLLVINADGTYESRLAESWKVSDESDKITFHLNKDAKWHDGEPLTAEDVVFTFQVAAHPDAELIRRTRIAHFAGTDENGNALPEDLQITALDEYTVEFVLKNKMDPEMIFALVNRDIFMMPKHILEDIPMSEIATDPYWNKPVVGSGPLKFIDMISGDHIEMEANEDYFLGAPDFDRFIVKVTPTSNFLTGLMSNEIDVIGGGSFASIPLKDWDLTQEQDNLTTASVSSLGYQYMSINTEKEYLSEPVRQAINMAINRDLIVEQLLKGEGEAAIGPLPQSHKYFNEAILPIEYDIEKAKKMVKESGFDSSKELIFLVPAGNEIREKSAPLIQQDLEEIGIKTSIQTMDFPTLLTAVRDSEYDFALVGSAGSLDPEESVSLVSVDSPNNFAHVSDPTLQEIGMRGLEAVSFEERKPIYDEYQMTLKEQVPFAWLYFADTLYAHNNRISNIDVDDFFVNSKVWEWKVD